MGTTKRKTSDGSQPRRGPGSTLAFGTGFIRLSTIPLSYILAKPTPTVSMTPYHDYSPVTDTGGSWTGFMRT